MEREDCVYFDKYQRMATRFVEQNCLDDSEAQFKVTREEVNELWKALGEEDGVPEEMADVVITVFILAEIEGVDLRKEYVDKMEYNLKKSGKKNEHGKVIDDVEAEE